MSKIPTHDASKFTWQEGVGTIALADVLTDGMPPFVGWDGKHTCFDIVGPDVKTRFNLGGPDESSRDENGFLKHLNFSSEDGTRIRLLLTTALGKLHPGCNPVESDFQR